MFAKQSKMMTLFIALMCMMLMPTAQAQSSSQSTLIIAPPESDILSSPASQGSTALLSSWDSALVANGSSADQAAYAASAQAAQQAIFATDLMLAQSSSADEWYEQVQETSQLTEPIKYQFYGQMLLAAVPSEGTSVSVNSGQYLLRFYPSSQTLILVNASTNQTVVASSNLWDIKPYLTSNDISALPYSTGSVTTSGSLAAYSSSRLASAVQAGNSANIALASAQDYAGQSQQQKHGVKYYILHHLQITVTVKSSNLGILYGPTMTGQHYWSPSKAPSDATQIANVPVDHTDTQKFDAGWPYGTMTVTVNTRGYELVYKK